MSVPPIVISGYPFLDATSLVTLPNPIVTRPRTDGLAIHHTGISAPYFPDQTAEEAYIQRLSSYDTQTWGSSSYHAYAFPSGRVYVVGMGGMILPDVAYENDHLEGIVFVGDYRTQIVNPAMIGNVAKWVLAKWRQRQFCAVKGHRDWVNLVLHPTWATVCPGDNVVNSIDTILRVVEALAQCPGS